MTVSTSPIDEETPLLSTKANHPDHVATKIERTPIPWGQFSLLLLLQLAEPLTSQVIYPFAPQLIREIGITDGDEGKVGYYTGLLQSLFFLTQAFTVLQWSRMSDQVGRKKVILIGLFGLCLSMYSFGLSTTFWGLVASRSLNGALNGNIGVMKSMLAELTDSTNISQAYALLPLAWSTGSTLGPIIGGSLSHPVERFPNVFGDSDFLKKYPYFLPCAVPATFTAIAWIVTFFYLKETVRSPISIAQLFKFRTSKSNLVLQNVVGSQEPSASVIPEDPSVPAEDQALPLRALLTRRVVVAAANYASLSLVDIAYRAVLPLFLSTPIKNGGLGMMPNVIGNILSVFGVLNGVFQVFFFAKIHDRWGSKRVFTAGLVSALPVFASFPLLSYLVKLEGFGATLWTVIGLQIVVSIAMSLSYGAIFIYIAAASPNRASLGAVNGLCQMTVSAMRAIGPAAANSLFSLSIEKNLLHGSLVYYILMGVAGVAIMGASLLPNLKV